MDKMQLMLGTATVVFAVGAVLVAVTHWGGPLVRWVKAKAVAFADWIDDGIERVTGWDGAPIDWDAVAANAGAADAARGACPECFGQPGASLRAENAILRTNAAAGRAELQTLRHRVAMLNDTIAAADRRIAEITASAVESAREVERLLRERAMAKPAGLKRASAPKLRAVPGAAMGDA